MMSPSFFRFTILILFIGLSLQVSQQLTVQYSFEEFEKQYGRNYTGEDRQNHRKAFQANYQQLLSMKTNYDGVFTLKVNNFLDMTDDQKQSFFGYTPSKLSVPFDSLPKSNKLQSIALPLQLNYSALAKVTPVKNQGNCGDCWAFTAAAVLQSKMLMLGAGQFDFSEQYILQCTPNSTCSGGWPYIALNTISGRGVPLESQYPYKANIKAYDTDQICSEQLLTTLPNEVDLINHYNSISDKQLKQILIDHGPVSVGIKGSVNGFLYYSGGVFSGCDSITSEQQIDHVVLLVGWTKQNNWIIKNSWGMSWGQDGFGVIDGTKNCGINSFVDVLVLKQESNTEANSANNNAQVGPNEMQVVKVTLSDSFGDGWNGYIFGIRQNNRIVTVFGQDFKSGAEQGPLDIQIKSGLQTEIVVVVAGSNSQDIGFTIIDSDGNKVCSRDAGSKFTNDIIFCTFCPNCVASNKVVYDLTLTSRGNNGWGGNVLAFNQDGVIKTFGQQFLSGNKYGPRSVEFIKNIPVQISISELGKKSQDIGFQLRDFFGNIVFKRLTGSALEADSTLGEFCPSCTNLFSVKTLQQLTAQEPEYQSLSNNSVSLSVFITTVSILLILVIAQSIVVYHLTQKNQKSNNLDRGGSNPLVSSNSLGSMGNIPCQSVLIQTQTVPDESNKYLKENKILS